MARTSLTNPSIPVPTSGSHATNRDYVLGLKIHDFALPTAATPMGGQKFTGLAAGSSSGDSVRYEQVLLLTGGTMAGAIAMGSSKITGLAAATANGDAVRYEQVVGVYQPVDSDLTTIAGLTATTDSFMQAKAGAWSARTVAQVVTDLAAGGLLTSVSAASTYLPLAGGALSGGLSGTALAMSGAISGASLTLTSASNAGIEMGDSSQAGTTPYIDMKFGRSVAGDDYNMRIINNADGRIDINARVGSTALVRIQGNAVATLANKVHEFALPTAPTPMNTQKFTGLAAGTANGDSLRYEQLFTSGALTLLGGLTIPSAAVFVSPAVVSSLPVSPADGQECYYQSSDMATNGVVWHLKYRSGGHASYKWEFVGGSSISSNIDTAQTINSGTFIDLTASEGVAIPLAVIYEIQCGALIIAMTGTSSAGIYSPSGAGVTAADVHAARVDFNTSGSGSGSMANRVKNHTLTIGTLRMKARSSGSVNIDFSQRFLYARPIRVG